jgi:ubiquinone/menaquinone biosynthesis C-methylase UbiE
MQLGASFFLPTIEFFDKLTPFYHLIYADWKSTVRQHGEALDQIMRSAGVKTPCTVLDAACGIGTQTLGLASLGYQVTASDFSAASVERAQKEADQRGFSIQTSVADMRELYAHHHRTFDVVIACDNAIPHLLSDAEIMAALNQFHRCTTLGGHCLISVRDYTTVDFRKPGQVHPNGVHQVEKTRYVLLQVWNPLPPLHETITYIIEHREGALPVTHTSHETCYAVPIYRLMRFMEEAGFSDVRRLDGVFFQPVIIGRKKEERNETADGQ